MSVDLNTFLNKIFKSNPEALERIVFEGNYEEGLTIKEGRYRFRKDPVKKNKYAFNFQKLGSNPRFQSWSTDPDVGNVRIDSITLVAGLSGNSCIVKLGRRIWN